MDEIKALSGHWPEEQVHFEDFNPQAGRDFVNSAFSVSIKSTGDSFRGRRGQHYIGDITSERVEGPELLRERYLWLM